MAIAAFASVVAIVLAAILLMRFRKRWLAAFNLAVTNRISSRFAPRLPGFGITGGWGLRACFPRRPSCMTRPVADSRFRCA